jgi:hypothetical protein
VIQSIATLIAAAGALLNGAAALVKAWGLLRRRRPG